MVILCTATKIFNCWCHLSLYSSMLYAFNIVISTFIREESNKRYQTNRNTVVKSFLDNAAFSQQAVGASDITAKRCLLGGISNGTEILLAAPQKRWNMLKTEEPVAPDDIRKKTETILGYDIFSYVRGMSMKSVVHWQTIDACFQRPGIESQYEIRWAPKALTDNQM